MKQINTFYCIKNQRELNQLINELDGKFGFITPKYKNNPKKFPVILTYQFSNDMNGSYVYFKHITIEQVEALITSLETKS